MTGGYDEASAQRYARVESRPDSFSLRIAPRLERLFNHDRSPSPDAFTMLDVGCGTGQLTDYFRAAGFVTVGVDRSPAMLRHRVGHRSCRRGAVAIADAAHLPLVGEFDLVTATFNVLNHLPHKAAVASLLFDVSRLLAPSGLFVFDINTAMGLHQTSERIEIHASNSDQAIWSRRWVDDRLVLHVAGSFRSGGTWQQYSETIQKLVIQVDEIDGWCAAAGLQRPSWRSDDLVTALENPEANIVAYGVVQGCVPCKGKRGDDA